MSLVWAFLSGVFLVNAVPHFVHGISGEAFFTPFSHFSGDTNGKSSALLNVLWAGFNLALGALLFRVGQVCMPGNSTNQMLFIAGGALIAVTLSLNFAKRSKLAGQKTKKHS